MPFAKLISKRTAVLASAVLALAFPTTAGNPSGHSDVHDAWASFASADSGYGTSGAGAVSVPYVSALPTVAEPSIVAYLGNPAGTVVIRGAKETAFRKKNVPSKRLAAVNEEATVSVSETVARGGSGTGNPASDGSFPKAGSEAVANEETVPAPTIPKISERELAKRERKDFFERSSTGRRQVSNSCVVENFLLGIEYERGTKIATKTVYAKLGKPMSAGFYEGYEYVTWGDGSGQWKVETSSQSGDYPALFATMEKITGKTVSMVSTVSKADVLERVAVMGKTAQLSVPMPYLKGKRTHSTTGGTIWFHVVTVYDADADYLYYFDTLKGRTAKMAWSLITKPKTGDLEFPAKFFDLSE